MSWVRAQSFHSDILVLICHATVSVIASALSPFRLEIQEYQGHLREYRKDHSCIEQLVDIADHNAC